MKNVIHLGSKEPGSKICIFVQIYQPASYWKCNLFCLFFRKFSSWLLHWTPWKKPKSHFYVPMSTIIILPFPRVRCQSTWGVKFPICWSHKFTTECDCILGSPLLHIFHFVSLPLIHIWSSFFLLKLFFSWMRIYSLFFSTFFVFWLLLPRLVFTSL